MKKSVILFSILGLLVIALPVLGLFDFTGNQILGSRNQILGSKIPVCKWIGENSIVSHYKEGYGVGMGLVEEGVPLGQACTKALSKNYKAAAYQRIQERWLYSDSLCGTLIDINSDERVVEVPVDVQNYPGFGELVGGEGSECRQSILHDKFEKFSEKYNGVLCCKT